MGDVAMLWVIQRIASFWRVGSPHLRVIFSFGRLRASCESNAVQTTAHRQPLWFPPDPLPSLHLSATPHVGRVAGQILDPSGAPVAGARLKLLNSAATVIREAKSDEQGTFILSDIDPGGVAI